MICRPQYNKKASADLSFKNKVAEAKWQVNLDKNSLKGENFINFSKFMILSVFKMSSGSHLFETPELQHGHEQHREEHYQEYE